MLNVDETHMRRKKERGRERKERERGRKKPFNYLSLFDG